MKSVNINYLPALDHLRGFASLLIIVYHGFLFLNNYFGSHQWYQSDNFFTGIIAEGHTAVSLFMVLSGFIFAYGSRNKSINYFGFLYNRFLRIYPMFLFLTIIGILLFPDSVSVSGFLKTVFLMANMPGAIRSPMTMTFWTISIEFQFYLIFPFLMHLMRKYGVRSIILLIILTLSARAIKNAFYMPEGHYIVADTLLERIDQFLIGMIAAELFARSSKSFRYLLIPSVFLLLALTFVYNRLGGLPAHMPWTFAWPAVEGAAWALVLLSYITNFRGSSGMVSSLLCRLGEISFSLYLLHFMIWFVLIANRWYVMPFSDPIRNTFANMAIVLPICIIISTITYNLIEKPFLRFRVKYLTSLNP